MIRVLAALVRWLEARFPEKFVVTSAAYHSLLKDLCDARVELDILRDDLRELKSSHAATIDRVAHLEASAVHKGAVQDLIGLVKAQKDELVSMKASLGWNRTSQAEAELGAILNGEPLSHE